MFSNAIEVARRIFEGGECLLRRRRDFLPFWQGEVAAGAVQTMPPPPPATAGRSAATLAR
jgi:hypothetical protein